MGKQIKNETRQTDHPSKNGHWLSDFELFKSEALHRFNHMGYDRFITFIEEKHIIDNLMELERFAEALYLVSLEEYCARIFRSVQLNHHANLHDCVLSVTIYPKSVLDLYTITKDPAVLASCRSHAIPEFAYHNIMEGDIYDIC